jgi:hypothetical protein
MLPFRSSPGVPNSWLGAAVRTSRRALGFRDVRTALRAACVVAAIQVVAGSCPPCPAADVFVRGRVNSDDAVNITDAISVLDYLFTGGPPPACLKAADVNDDGAVNISDPLFLLGYLFLGTAEIPPPHPNPGQDLTPDALSCTGSLFTAIEVTPAHVTLAEVGRLDQLSVIGKGSGRDVDLHEGTQGTRYTSSAPAVAGVYRDGRIEARSPGTALITVENAGLVATADVTVSAAGGSSRHRVLAVNDLGMHCMDTDFSVFTILPPFNVVHAQVTRSETAGKVTLLDDSEVDLRYSPVPDATGSVNSSSLSKTGFWETAAQVFGAPLEPARACWGSTCPTTHRRRDRSPSASTW